MFFFVCLFCFSLKAERIAWEKSKNIYNHQPFCPQLCSHRSRYFFKYFAFVFKSKSYSYIFYNAYPVCVKHSLKHYWNKTIDTLLTDLFEFIKSNTLTHLWVTSKILALPVQMKSLFGVTCALSQKTLKSSDEYPTMGLPWLLTIHVTTAVIMNGHKSRHKFKTWEV